MSALRLIEISQDMIEKAIQDGISAALTDVKTSRGDNTVSLPLPQTYLRYEDAKVVRFPAVFTIVEGERFNNAELQANHINATDEISVAVVVQDRTQLLAQKAAFRYQAALVKILHLTTLTSLDGGLRLFSRVEDCRFSSEFAATDGSQLWRKEVLIRLAVEHVENLN